MQDAPTVPLTSNVSDCRDFDHKKVGVVKTNPELRTVVSPSRWRNCGCAPRCCTVFVCRFISVYFRCHFTNIYTSDGWNHLFRRSRKKRQYRPETRVREHRINYLVKLDVCCSYSWFSCGVLVWCPHWRNRFPEGLFCRTLCTLESVLAATPKSL